MKGSHILITSNRSDYVNNARQALNYHSDEYSTDYALSADECFAKLMENHYQLLLFDINLDKKQGAETLIRIIRSGIDIRVAILIDKSDSHLIQQYLEIGAIAYILKSDDHFEKLPGIISKILKKSGVSQPEPVTKPASPRRLPQKPKKPGTQLKKELSRFSINPDGVFTSANQQLQTKLGFDSKEIIERKLEDILHPAGLSDYFIWREHWKTEKISDHKTSVIGKAGIALPVEISIFPIRNSRQQIIRYEGTIDFLKVDAEQAAANFDNGSDRQFMLKKFHHLIQLSHTIATRQFFEKITLMACKIFGFQQSSLFLLDRRRGAFVQQTTTSETNGANQKQPEIPQSSIERLFIKPQQSVGFISHADTGNQLTAPLIAEHAGFDHQKESDRSNNNNIVILKLTDQRDKSFGYISLIKPTRPTIQSLQLYQKLELFSNLASIAIENYYWILQFKRRYHKVERLFARGDIFRLDSTEPEIIEEFAWSVKSALDFNLVMVGLIGSSKNLLNVKATACENRDKSIQLSKLSFPLDELRKVFKLEHRISKTYLIEQPEPLLAKIKELYYDSESETSPNRSWDR
ncbi:MAG: response regulator, partial [bacterium]|nr:response regulator [bacterium]